MRRRGIETDLDLDARVARLTPGQRACLDLVDDHATSKEIALQLGISRHTVDARLRQAMQVLGVTSRREAAIIWRASALAREAGGPAAGVADGYQPFAYQPSRIEDGSRTADPAPHEPLFALPDHSAGDADGDPLAAAGLAARHLGGRVPGQPAGFAGDASGREANPVPELADAAAWAWPAPAAPGTSLRLWGGANDLTLPQRLAGILIVTIMAMLAFGLLLSGIAALIQLRT